MPGAPLRDEIADKLREGVISGYYRPGDRLVERDLATEHGVSRVPVREALQALVADGWLRPVGTRGLVVRGWTRTEAAELFDLREALEPLAARQAAVLRDDEAVATMRRWVALSAGGDDQESIRANAEFHVAMVRASRNATLRRVMEPLQGRMRWLLALIDEPHDMCPEHARIAEAIAVGDPDLAARETFEHARVNRERTLAGLGDHDPVVRRRVRAAG